MIAKIVRTSGKCWLRRWSCVFVKLSKGLHVEWISRLSAAYAVRVKGGMSLRNGMWHGLQNDIIMWNVIYAE